MASFVAAACRSGNAPSNVVDAAPSSSPRVLVEKMERSIEAHYVFPDVGARMVAVLRENTARGDYDALAPVDVFAARITSDLRGVSNDRHLLLEHLDGPPPPMGMPTSPDHGIHRAPDATGNVAVVIIDAFEPGEAARAAMGDVMSTVADATALVIDVRKNHGGDPSAVAFVASYLFDDAPVHVNDMYWRDDGSTQAFWTSPSVPGKRFGGAKPVFVLTSEETFSAAEEFAYDLQSLRRARIVGATTKGGAHPVFVQSLDGGFSLRVPTGRAINPVTHTDWEGTGVVPDVKTPANEALEAALALPRWK